MAERKRKENKPRSGGAGETKKPSKPSTKKKSDGGDDK